MNTKDGGPAFPAKDYIVPADLQDRHVRVLGATQGMTLRDYFAAKASESDVAAHTHIYGEADGIKLCIGVRTREQAKFAYADAMLAAREPK